MALANANGQGEKRNYSVLADDERNSSQREISVPGREADTIFHSLIGEDYFGENETLRGHGFPYGVVCQSKHTYKKKNKALKRSFKKARDQVWLPILDPILDGNTSESRPDETEDEKEPSGNRALLITRFLIII